MASTVENLLIGKFVGILESEASSILGVRDQVNKIYEELVSMKSFLQDAEDKEATNVEIIWIESIRHLAYDIEDIIEEFMYHMYEHQSGNKFASWIYKSIDVPKHIWYSRKIAKKLKNIEQKIHGIPVRRQRLESVHFGPVQERSNEDIRKWGKNQAEAALFIMEDQLVGIEGKKQVLIDWLMKKEQHQTIVSVVGMGGSGKTTLVAKTFMNEKVKSQFDCSAWITISPAYVIEDLFKNLIKEFYKSCKQELPVNFKDMNHKELLETLVNFLHSKRYLVVLDDVWNKQLLTEIWISLPNRQLSSRIMLTTRNEEVACYAFGIESFVYRMKSLESNEAWDLFHKKTFSTYPNKLCPPELRETAWLLVEKCRGLPLAILAISGLMSNRKSAEEWKSIYENLSWHLSNNPDLEPMKTILFLSFKDLPYPLKQCFIYCSLFPEDYKINRRRLTSLWIAEGFVEKVAGMTEEQVAKSYLMELVFRSMLQFVRRDYAYGIPYYCIMHDLMREIALTKSKEERFGMVYDGRTQNLQEIKARRLSIQIKGGEIKSCTGISQLRSFLGFSDGRFSLSISKTSSSRFKLLRALDLEDAPFHTLPDNLVYLFNLRFLSLKGSPITNLPKSIGLLRNLQTLDIRDTNIEEIPRGIAKAINLRDLLMGPSTITHGNEHFQFLKGIRVSSDVLNLGELQLLYIVHSEGDLISLVGKMTQLTRIGISNVKETDQTHLCASIQKMELLKILFLSASGEDEFLRMEALASPPKYLEELIFCGKLQQVPGWFRSLESLKYIELRWSRLEEDLIPHIQDLPSLEQVILFNVYVGYELCFNRGFQKLTHLQLSKFPSLSKITIDQGVMPNLQFLQLDRCKELKRLPHGLEGLAKLETLRLRDVSEELIESSLLFLVDHPRVQIPSIDHYYETSSIWQRI